MAENGIRRFGKFQESSDVQALVNLQRVSYARFLQQGISQEQRQAVGLESLLREIFPIVSYDDNMRLEYIGYELGKCRYSPDEWTRSCSRPSALWTGFASKVVSST